MDENNTDKTTETNTAKGEKEKKNFLIGIGIVGVVLIGGVIFKFAAGDSSAESKTSKIAANQHEVQAENRNAPSDEELPELDETILRCVQHLDNVNSIQNSQHFQQVKNILIADGLPPSPNMDINTIGAVWVAPLLQEILDKGDAQTIEEYAALVLAYDRRNTAKADEKRAEFDVIAVRAVGSSDRQAVRDANLAYEIVIEEIGEVLDCASQINENEAIATTNALPAKLTEKFGEDALSRFDLLMQ